MQMIARWIQTPTPPSVLKLLWRSPRVTHRAMVFGLRLCSRWAKPLRDGVARRSRDRRRNFEPTRSGEASRALLSYAWQRAGVPAPGGRQRIVYPGCCPGFMVITLTCPIRFTAAIVTITWDPGGKRLSATMLVMSSARRFALKVCTHRGPPAHRTETVAWEGRELAVKERSVVTLGEKSAVNRTGAMIRT
jgi:hypothetical protein